MFKKIIVALIRCAFMGAAVGLVAPFVLPFFHIRGGLIGATIAGVALLGLFPLMKVGIHKLLGLVPGACPMPKMQLPLVGAFWLGTALSLWLTSLVLPNYLQVGGFFGSILAALVVLIVTVLSNIFTRPFQVRVDKG